MKPDEIISLAREKGLSEGFISRLVAIMQPNKNGELSSEETALALKTVISLADTKDKLQAERIKFMKKTFVKKNETSK